MTVIFERVAERTRPWVWAAETAKILVLLINYCNYTSI